ncbi:MAG: hypothetical protein JW891_08915 [Candidatus Lokiarchaeota archaeon]|nr:hypothetical protein [Candidatus Lokiarchaeota archaeon]
MIFCPNCGNKIVDELQNFCQECGISLEELKKKKQNIPKANLVPTYNRPIIAPVKEVVDKDSRKVFVLGLISGIIATTGFSEGSLLLMPSIDMLESYIGSILITTQIISLIVLLALHSAGLALGIIGKVKSKNIIHDNSFKHWGAIFSLLGIIANSIGLILAIIIFPIFILIL